MSVPRPRAAVPFPPSCSGLCAMCFPSIWCLWWEQYCPRCRCSTCAPIKRPGNSFLQTDRAASLSEHRFLRNSTEYFSERSHEFPWFPPLFLTFIEDDFWANRIHNNPTFRLSAFPRAYWASRILAPMEVPLLPIWFRSFDSDIQTPLSPTDYTAEKTDCEVK